MDFINTGKLFVKANYRKLNSNQIGSATLTDLEIVDGVVTKVNGSTFEFFKDKYGDFCFLLPSGYYYQIPPFQAKKVEMKEENGKITVSSLFPVKNVA